MEHRRHQKGLEGQAPIPARHLQCAQMSKLPPGRSGTTRIQRTLPQALGQLQPLLAHCLLFANKVLLTAVPICVHVSPGCFCHMAAEWSSHEGGPLACRAGDIPCCAHQPRRHGAPLAPRRPWGRGSSHFCSRPGCFVLVLFITQLRLPLCDPVGCSPPASSLHGLLQARVLEWIAISFSRGSSQPRD